MPQNALAPTPVNSLLDAVNPASIYRRNVDTPKRVYGEALIKTALGRKEMPMTEVDFTPQELEVLSQLVNEHHQKKLAYFSRPKEQLFADANKFDKEAKIMALRELKEPDIKGNVGLTSKGLAAQAKLLRAAAEGNMPKDFRYGYEDFMDTAVPSQGINWRDSLGRFRYKVDPETNTFKIYDMYEFDNKGHAQGVNKYVGMTPAQRFKSAISDFLAGKEAALGEAYLGTNQGMPIQITVNKSK